MLEAIERIEQGLRLAPRKLTPAGVLVAEILDDTVASWVAVLRNLIAETKAIEKESVDDAERIAALELRDSQWRLKWEAAVDTGTSNRIRETERAEAAEARCARLAEGKSVV